MSFIILDPNLIHGHGHHMEWDLTIAAAARSREQDVVIFAHRDFALPETAGVEIVPWFSHSCYEELAKDRFTGRFDDFRYYNDKLADELTLLPRDRFGVADVVVVPTLTERHLLGYVSWMKSFETVQAPLFVIHLMFSSGLAAPLADGQFPIADSFQALFYSLAFKRAFGPGPDIHFFAGGRQLAREFSELCGHRVDAYPLPNCPKRRTAPAGERSRPTALLFAGDVKSDKGFQGVPALAQRLSERHPTWEFLVHANAGAAWGESLAAYDRLLALPELCPNLRIVTGRLTREQYLVMLENADCFLCTYDPAVYARKSSGIIWEAISLGLPVLAPAGTWLDRELKEWGLDYAAYEDSSLDGMVEAFGRFILGLAEYASQAAAAAERYHLVNGADALVNQIGRLWAPRIVAAQFMAQPRAESVPLESIGWMGWSFPETISDTPVRWVGKEFDIEFDWPFSSPWRVEIKVLRSFDPEQLLKAKGDVAGRSVALATVVDDFGGVIVATGRGRRRDHRHVTLRIQLPWTVRPENETRDLGVLINGLLVGPGITGDAEGDEPQPAFEILTAVTQSEDGRSFQLNDAVSGTMMFEIGKPAHLAFGIRTPDPALARSVRLYVNGSALALDVVADGRNRWHARADCPAHLARRRGYLAEWDLLLDGEPSDIAVWISDLALNDQRARPSVGQQARDLTKDPAPDSLSFGEAAPFSAERDGVTARFEDVRLHEHFVGDEAYSHLDVSVAGMAVNDEGWAKVRFKFCCGGNHCYIEFRSLPGWPEVIPLGPDVGSDQFGPVLRIGDGKPMPVDLTRREKTLVEGIAVMLPEVVRVLISRAEQVDNDLARWIDRSRRASRTGFGAGSRESLEL